MIHVEKHFLNECQCQNPLVADMQTETREGLPYRWLPQPLPLCSQGDTCKRDEDLPAVISSNCYFTADAPFNPSAQVHGSWKHCSLPLAHLWVTTQMYKVGPLSLFFFWPMLQEVANCTR